MRRVAKAAHYYPATLFCLFFSWGITFLLIFNGLQLDNGFA